MTTDDLLSCGRSIDELSDYLAAGRQPSDPYIDSCPECQAALGALSQLNQLTGELISYESQPTSQKDADWLSSMFSNIALEARAGRNIPLKDITSDAVESTRTETELSQTEGSVIALIRSTVDSSDGVVVGRCRIEGNITEPDAAAGVSIRITVLVSDVETQPPLQKIAMKVRNRVMQVLLRHTQLRVETIDVTINDVHVLEHEGQP